MERFEPKNTFFDAPGSNGGNKPKITTTTKEAEEFVENLKRDMEKGRKAADNAEQRGKVIKRKY